jgi:hypothetical protein
VAEGLLQVPEVSGSRPTGSAATIDRRGVMLGTLILAPLKLVGACVWCPCVVVPGENLADPARLVPRARQEATAIFTGLVVRIDTVETRSSPDQSTASPRTDAPASFLGCAYQKPSCERSDRGLILEGSDGPGWAPPSARSRRSLSGLRNVAQCGRACGPQLRRGSLGRRHSIAS